MRVDTKQVTFIEEGRIIIDGIEYKPLLSHAVLAEVRALKARNEKLTDIINWMSNGYGIDQMESEYDIEMAEIESEHFS